MLRRRSTRLRLPVPLHVEVRDARNRQPVAARCYLTDESGKPLTPSGAFTYEKRQEHHFIIQQALNTVFRRAVTCLGLNAVQSTNPGNHG